MRFFRMTVITDTELKHDESRHHIKWEFLDGFTSEMETLKCSPCQGHF